MSKTAKNMVWIGIIILCAVIIGFFVYFFSSFTVNPELVNFSKVNVNNQEINMKNGSFTGSAMWYSGNTTQFQDGILTVKIFARSIKFLGSTSDPFTINIPNRYGNITKIRLSGGDRFQDRVIWTLR